TSLNNDQYRDQLAKGVNQFSRRGKADAGQWKAFAEHIEYQVSEISSLDAYALQAETIQRYRSEWKEDPIVIYYLAVAPRFFTTIAQNLARDRKSTRLNSSHVKISYAVFCLKKKTR